jgi:hypothetical protein
MSIVVDAAPGDAEEVPDVTEVFLGLDVVIVMMHADDGDPAQDRPEREGQGFDGPAEPVSDDFSPIRPHEVVVVGLGRGVDQQRPSVRADDVLRATLDVTRADHDQRGPRLGDGQNFHRDSFES